MTTTNTAMQKATSGALAFGEQIGYTPEYVQLIKDTYAKDATDNELQMFLEVCHQSKLNPFKKEIHFWKQGGKVVIHTGIDGYRLTADRTGRYAPGPPIKRGYDDEGRHISSTAYVRKKVGSDWFTIEETANMKEWTKDSPFWKGDKASHQLDITAERHALRKAFPSSFPADLGNTNPDGSASEDAALDTPEMAAERAHLIENLLRIGKLFANDEQYKTLEATVNASPLPVLQERYTNALVKLREYTLGKIGERLSGDAYGKFIVEAFTNGLDAAEADEFFTALDSLEGFIASQGAAPAPATNAALDPDEAGERSAIQGEPVSDEEAATAELREKVMDKLMTMSNGDSAKIDELLDGRVVPNMTTPQLEKFLKKLTDEMPF